MRLRPNQGTSGVTARDRSEYYKTLAVEGKVCHAIAHIRHRGGGNEPNAQPWLTAVLGSGCLETVLENGPTEFDGVPELIGEAVSGKVRVGVFDSDVIAQEFARKLVEDRLGRPLAARPQSVTMPPVLHPSILAAELTYLAALMTSLFHWMTWIRPSPSLRRGGEAASVVAVTKSAEDAETVGLLQETRQQIATCLVIARAIPADDEYEFLLARIESIESELKQGRVSKRSADTVADLAWWEISKGSLMYPGWSDVLLHLGVLSKTQVWGSDGTVRPSFTDLKDARAAIIKRYDSVTKASWNRVEPDTRSEFYAAIATVLNQQSTFVRDRVGANPVPSAYVTTFDLELEMALLRDEGTTGFVIVCPFYAELTVGAESAHRATLLWMGCRVGGQALDEPRIDDAEQLIRNRSEWFLCTRETFAENPALRRLPHVVRLAGCPLIDLPKLRVGDDWTGLARQIIVRRLQKDPNTTAAGHLRLAHALLLDDYASLWHTAADFTDAGSKGRLLGLPDELRGSVQGPSPRFWFVAGVQVDDHAVRTRVAAQILYSAIRHDVDGATSVGMVVGRRLDDVQTDLLRRYNFDVINGDCHEHTQDLRHYAEHLRRPDAEWRMTEKCEI